MSIYRVGFLVFKRQKNLQNRIVPRLSGAKPLGQIGRWQERIPTLKKILRLKMNKKLEMSKNNK
jgi:hypothetical protein